MKYYGKIEENSKDLVTAEYVETHGGKIDKIEVNGIEQPITDKKVSISAVPTSRTISGKQLNTNITLNAGDIGAGTFTGAVKASTSAATTLTTGQLRNIFISTQEPTSADGNNGDIWILYEE